jgi:lipoate-protein ligase A
VGWRLLPFATAPPQQLVDTSARLLDDLAEDQRPILRWYRSTEPALVLGRGQAGIASGSLPVIARYSGGGAVLLDDGLLSLDVLLPAGHPMLDGDLTEVFIRVGTAWADALGDLGLGDVAVHRGAGQARRRGSQREQLLAAICYATLGRGEVTVGGRKVVGLSQRRRRPGALVQCGLLRRWNPQPLLAAFGADPHDREIVMAAAGLDDLLATPPDDAKIIAAVNRRLERVQGAT